MNKISSVLFCLVAVAGTLNFSFSPYAQATKSEEYMQGYRDGTVQGSADVDAYNAGKVNHLNGNNPPPCHDYASGPDWCAGWASA
jgi:hypothetical protein